MKQCSRELTLFLFLCHMVELVHTVIMCTSSYTCEVYTSRRWLYYFFKHLKVAELVSMGQDTQLAIPLSGNILQASFPREGQYTKYDKNITRLRILITILW